MSDVRLQFLLKRHLDTEEMMKIEELVARLGARVTGRGQLTLSARMPRQQFEKVFGTASASREALAANRGDELTLPVPAELTDYVESVSQAPLHLRMDD